MSELDADQSPNYPKSILPSRYDLSRSQGAQWSYLLKPRQQGEVHITSRGKQLAFAVGHVKFFPSI